MNKKYKKLIWCIILDSIGMASYSMPMLDVAWAPFAAFLSYRMFGEKRGKYTALFTFIEEALPFTDAIPSFTIFWIMFDLVGLSKESEKKNNKKTIKI